MSTERITRQIFTYFYKNLLQDPYTSTFFPNPQVIDTLIHKQSKMVEDFLDALTVGKDLTPLKERYRYSFELHKRLQIEEHYMFDAIDFIEHSLKNYTKEGLLDLRFDQIEGFSDYLKAENAKVYIQGILEETIFIWERLFESSDVLQSEPVFQSHIDFYKKLLGSLDRGDATIANSFSCKIGRYFDSLEFLVKSHGSQQKINFILHFHNQTHSLAARLLDYYAKEDYIKALRITRLLNLHSYLFLLLIIDIFSNWKIAPENALYTFLTDPLFCDKTLNFFFTGKRSGAIEKEMFFKISQELTHKLNSIAPTQIFAYSLAKKERFYILLLEERRNKRIELLQKITETIKEHISNHPHYPANTIRAIFNGVFVDISSLLDDGLSYKDTKIFFNLLERHVRNNPSKELLFDDRSVLRSILKEAKEERFYYDLFEKWSDDLDLELFVQPLYHLKNTELYGGEILARIKVNDQYIPAGKFISFIKETNNTKRFDLTILDKLIESIKSHDIELKTIFVNLFPTSYMEQEIIDTIHDLNEAAKKRGIRIVLEITEYENIGTITNIELFNNLTNVTLAIDDFGAGYSNFSSLSSIAHQKKVAIIKVDGHFVKEAINDETTQKILQSIIYTINLLEKEVVFEFIESKEIEEMLKKLTKKLNFQKEVLVQGFYYSKPQHLKDFYLSSS